MGVGIQTAEGCLVLVLGLFDLFLCRAREGSLVGFLARLLDQKSKLGAILDPMADKLLINISFVALTIMGILPAWLTFIVFGRDLLIFYQWQMFVNFSIVGRIQYGATNISKWNTFFQMSTIFLAILLSCKFYVPFIFDILYVFFQYATALLTAFTGVHYILIGLDEFE